MVYNQGARAFEFQHGGHEFESQSLHRRSNLCVDGVYSLVVRARGLEYGGREFESRSLHYRSRRPNFVRKGGFLVVERVLRPYRWPRHLLSLKPAKTAGGFLAIERVLRPYCWTKPATGTQKVISVLPTSFLASPLLILKQCVILWPCRKCKYPQGCNQVCHLINKIAFSQITQGIVDTNQPFNRSKSLF